MGVPGLWKELQSHGKDVTLHNLVHTPLTGLPYQANAGENHVVRLGIDTSAWLYHALQAQGGFQPALRLLFFRFCKLLAQPRLDVTLVFDGPLRPSEKRGILRHSDAIHLPYEQGGAAGLEQVQEMAHAFGFATVFARGEAEAELARLNAQGELDAILTDDVDALVFGAKIVVRNWGHKLSGNVARQKYVAGEAEGRGEEVGGEDEEVLSSASCSASSQTASPSSRSKARKGAEAAGDVITIYRARDIEEQGQLSRDGLILVALISGGDYDVQGLPRCGAKISVALARGGYGDSLLAGIRTHIAPLASPNDPSYNIHDRGHHHRRPECPQPGAGWMAFRTQWIQSIRDELSSNSSGLLPKRYQVLSKSAEWDLFLGTNASLSVMASYVWPVVGSLSRSDNRVDRTMPVHVGRIAEVVQRTFHWQSSWVLERMRNNVWPGLVIRQIARREIDGILDRGERSERRVDLRKTAVTSSPRKARKNASAQQIDRFFTATKPTVRASSRSDVSDKSMFVKNNDFERNAPTTALLSIHGEKRAGNVECESEVRVLYDVEHFVRAAKKCLVEDIEGDVSGTQKEVYSSPSKTRSPRKARVDAETPLRVWVPICVVNTCPTASKLLKDFRRKEEERRRKKDGLASMGRKGSNVFLSASKSSLAGQPRLDRFFAPLAPLDTSPRKRAQQKSPAASVELSSSEDDDDDEGRESRSSSSSSFMPSPPPSPTLSRSTMLLESDDARTPVRVSSYLSQRDLTPRGVAQSDDVTPVKTTANKSNVGDDSVEFVEIRPAPMSSQDTTKSAASAKQLQSVSKSVERTISLQSREVIDVFDDSDESSDEEM